MQALISAIFDSCMLRAPGRQTGFVGGRRGVNLRKCAQPLEVTRRQSQKPKQINSRNPARSSCDAAAASRIGSIARRSAGENCAQQARLSRKIYSRLEGILQAAVANTLIAFNSNLTPAKWHAPC
jgi:hypothetical protein